MLKSIDCKIIRSWSVAKRTWDNCYSYLFIRQSTGISILTEAELEMLQKPLVATSRLEQVWAPCFLHDEIDGVAMSAPKGWHGLMGCSCEPWDGLRGDGRMMLDLHTLCLDFHFEADYRGDLQPWWNAWYDQFCFFAGGPCGKCMQMYCMKDQRKQSWHVLGRFLWRNHGIVNVSSTVHQFRKVWHRWGRGELGWWKKIHMTSLQKKKVKRCI